MFLRLKRNITSNLPLIISLLIIILVIILCGAHSTYSKEFITGSSVIIAALLTTWTSLKQFYVKQQSLRFQKFYFEDTLYTLAKSVDNIMQSTTNNFFLIEAFRNKQYNITKLNIEINRKAAFVELFKETQAKFIVAPSISTFSLHTTQCLLNNSIPSFLTTWLKAIEIDSIRVSQYLLGQLSNIELLLEKLNENNITQFEKSVKENIEYRTYILLKLFKRHDILFNWLSIIIFHFSSTDYSNYDKILEFWKSPLIIQILNHIDLAYKDLKIASDIDFSAITDEEAKRLHATTDDHYKKIADFQNKFKSVSS